MPSSTIVQAFETAENLARAAAVQFTELAKDAVADHDLFHVALAGGNTPRRMYELLAGDQLRSIIDWTTIHLYFGDERCVPPDHPESNFRLAYDALISHVDIPTTNVHRIVIEADATSSATRYEGELRDCFSDVEAPPFDLVLLGLGEDGHTASLFPHTSALSVTDKWVAANWIEKLAAYRITLTPAAINGASQVIFLVAGANKAAAVKAVLEGPAEPENLPAQLIKPQAGNLTWLLDSQAASMLSKH